jgi:hypothetical protein
MLHNHVSLVVRARNESFAFRQRIDSEHLEVLFQPKIRTRLNVAKELFDGLKSDCKTELQLNLRIVYS